MSNEAKVQVSVKSPVKREVWRTTGVYRLPKKGEYYLDRDGISVCLAYEDFQRAKVIIVEHSVEETEEEKRIECPAAIVVAVLETYKHFVDSLPVREDHLHDCCQIVFDRLRKEGVTL